MAICTTCYDTGITTSTHDCPGPQEVVVHREGDRVVIVEAPRRAAMDLELLFTERALIAMPGPGLIELAGQVVYRVTGYLEGRLTLELAEDRRPAAPCQFDPAAAQELMRQMDDDPHGLKAGMVVQAYREHGREKWVFRCWGTDGGCDGLLSLDHFSRQGAERARDRHVTEDHGGPTRDR